MGEEVFEICKTLKLEESDFSYDEVKQECGNYFQPKQNNEFERYKFPNTHQNKDISTDQYARRLRQWAEMKSKIFTVVFQGN